MWSARLTGRPISQRCAELYLCSSQDALPQPYVAQILTRYPPVAVTRRLARAPITEALIDVRAVPLAGLSEDVFKTIPSILKSDYPLVEERRASEAQLALEPGKPLRASSRDLGLQGVWLRSQDEKEVVQFRTDGFTYSRLAPYTSWEDILPRSLRLWKTFVEVLRPEIVTRLAVRYINHLPLPDGPVELDDFIFTAPKVPQGVIGEMGPFSTRVLLAHPERKLQAIVTQSIEPGVRSKRPTLLLDIDAFKTGNVGISAESIAPHLEALREYKNMIFFGSLTESFARSFE